MSHITKSDYGVIVQARMSSSRLSGKILMDIEGQPMLLRQLLRLRHGLEVSKLVVATSDEKTDDPVEELCRNHGFRCFRGSLNDVMDRFVNCANEFGIEYIIRVGGDDPLIDWECCNTLMHLHQQNPYDFLYASNREGWPYGCAAELFSSRKLKDIHLSTSDPLYLEHTIPYFFDHQNEFQILKVKAPASINRPDYYFTVDYPEDLELIRTIFKELKEAGDYFSLADVITLMDTKPELRKMNSHLHEGFEK